MDDGLNCYTDHQVRTHADNMGHLVQQEEAETIAVEQAVSQFLQNGSIRYGFGGSDTFTLEDLNHFIYDDEDLANEDEKAARVMRQGFGHPADSAERDTLLKQATELQDDLTYRAVVAMLKPHAVYFIGLDIAA